MLGLASAGACDNIAVESFLMADDKNLFDKAKDALGMGDDDEHRDARRTDVDRTDDELSRGGGQGWGEDTGGVTGTGGRTAGTGGTGYDTGHGPESDPGRASGAGGSAGTDSTMGGAGTTTRGGAASGESPLDDDDSTDTGRRESGM